MFGSLLVPVDGSDYALRALEVAARLAAPDAVMHLLHVRELLPPVHRDRLMSMEEAIQAASIETIEAQEQAIFERARACVAEHYTGEVMTHVHHGAPARAIVHEARALEVEVIVMGSRGLSDWGGMVMGSVSHKVSHIAPCMVISVHDEQGVPVTPPDDEAPWAGL